ncbi:Holliday junction branch migration protein RuvA [Candidatus Dojkabacteria bacterium]|nr:Holliday junction branch migration protein RuvA [Candidatus Dojkabacteria bacterium]
MISYLKGKIVEIGESYLVVSDASGVGYKVYVPVESEPWVSLESEQEVEVYTSQYFRENEQGLFGFTSPEERNFFELLITVSGVGPKLASTLLANLEHKALAQMIVEEDVPGISKVPGIGKKMAERLIVDLRDKVFGFEKGSSGKKPVGSSEEVAFLSQALVRLGFDKREIDVMIDEAQELFVDGKSVEDVLKDLLSQSNPTR